MEEKPAFWTSLPGILTGLATVITALTGVYLATRDGPSRSPAADAQAPASSPQAAPQRDAAGEWDVVAREGFSDNQARWQTGDFPDEYFRQRTLGIAGGRYRWNLALSRDWSGWAPAPYGPLTAFRVEVDAVVIESSVPGTSLGLVFGDAADSHYEFRIRDGHFGISLLNRAGHNWLIRETPRDINLGHPHRLAVQVVDGLMTFIIDGDMVGQYRDPAFNGGNIGMFAAGVAGGSATVEFDNFELRRKVAR